MKNFAITSDQFLSYLESLDIFRLTLSVSPLGAEATINSEPKSPSYFTQSYQLSAGLYFVRLSSADYLNVAITGGFFTSAAVDKAITVFMNEADFKPELLTRYAFAERWIEAFTNSEEVRKLFLSRFKAEVLDKN